MYRLQGRKIGTKKDRKSVILICKKITVYICNFSSNPGSEVDMVFCIKKMNSEQEVYELTWFKHLRSNILFNFVP